MSSINSNSTASAAATTAGAITAVASVLTTAVILRNLATDLIPCDLQSRCASIFSRLSSSLTITVDEFHGLASNRLYRAAETYLGSLAPSAASSPSRLRAAAADDDASSAAIELSLGRGEPVTDVFKGVKFTWRLESRDSHRPVFHRRDGRLTLAGSSMPFEARSYDLKFHKKYKRFAVDSYLPYILNRAEQIKQETKTLKLYTNEDDSWSSTTFHHPATFATLAMPPEQKKIVIEDLERFVRRKDYYRSIGKAWKRGYFLYGPPGTGKSSLVAAMANHLRFDVYYLELAEVSSNAGLRTLMAAAAGRSVLVVEDIDCSTDLRRRDADHGCATASGTEDNKVSLSGLLNFVDGLWSGCNDARIIVFTTNYKDRLDSALLRPGRMDMHVHMSYLCSTGFRTLASNYLGIQDHPLFSKIDKLIEKAEVTPAEAAEELLRSNDTDSALRGLIELLTRNNKQVSEAKEE